MRKKRKLIVAGIIATMITPILIQASNTCSNPTPGGACRPSNIDPAEQTTINTKAECIKRMCTGEASTSGCTGTGASKACHENQSPWSCVYWYYTTQTTDPQYGPKVTICNLDDQIPYDDVFHPSGTYGYCTVAKSGPDNCP